MLYDQTGVVCSVPSTVSAETPTRLAEGLSVVPVMAQGLETRRSHISNWRKHRETVL